MRTVRIDGAARAWTVRGGVAIADQALFAGSNFGFNVYLARSLSPPEYGIFTFTLAVFLALYGLYNALQLEPVSVLGPSRYAGRRRSYLRAQLRIHVYFAGALGTVLGVAGLAVSRSGGANGLGVTFVAAGLACPAILLYYLVRRLLYAANLAPSALAGSSVYACALCGAVLFGQRYGGLSPAVAFGLQASASVLGSVFMMWRLQRGDARGPEPSYQVRSLMWEHWNYGKWLIGVVLLQSLAVHGLTFMTTAMLGFGAVGVLRAMQSFVLPFGHTMIALFAVAQPVLARDFGRGDFGALGRRSTALVAAVTCLALACEVGLLAFHRQLEYVLFSGKFAAYSGLIPVFGAAAIFEGLSASQALVLRAVQRPRLHMLSVAFTAPVALTIGFVLIRWGGVWGAAAATAATWAISAAAAHPFSRRWFRLRMPVLLDAHPHSSPERGRNAHDREPNAVERAVDPA